VPNGEYTLKTVTAAGAEQTEILAAEGPDPCYNNNAYKTTREK
jgi:hypothetical protein